MRRLVFVILSLLAFFVITSCDGDWIAQLPDTVWGGEYDGFNVEVTFDYQHKGHIKVANAIWKFTYSEKGDHVLLTFKSDTTPTLEGTFNDDEMVLVGNEESQFSLFGTDEIHLFIY